MFPVSESCIGVRRQEPSVRDLTEAIEFVKKRNTLVTKKVLIEAILKKKPKKSSQRVKKLWESEMRLEQIAPFIAEYNKYRAFYVGREGDWSPKNNNQISCIETILGKVEKWGVDLGLFVACQFKSLAWIPDTPSVQVIVSKGADNYNKHYESVLNDLDTFKAIEDSYE